MQNPSDNSVPDLDPSGDCPTQQPVTPTEGKMPGLSTGPVKRNLERIRKRNDTPFRPDIFRYEGYTPSRGMHTGELDAKDLRLASTVKSSRPGAYDAYMLPSMVCGKHIPSRFAVRAQGTVEVDED